MEKNEVDKFNNNKICNNRAHKQTNKNVCEVATPVVVCYTAMAASGFLLNASSLIAETFFFFHASLLLSCLKDLFCRAR